MTTVLAAIALLALLAIAFYAAFVKGDYFVSESAVINAPRDKVFAAVVDLKNWPSWSPWLLHEPECELTYSESPAANEQGGSYEWFGKKVGAGKMTHVSVEAPARISQRLEFVKPFKSVCEVGWDFEEQGEATRVTWTMAGKMPFLFRLFAKTAKKMIAKDYDFGLRMLRREVDPDSPRFSIEFPGVSDFPAQRCVYAAYKGDMEGMKKMMAETFPKLFEAAKDENGSIPGMPMNVCLDMDEAAGLIEIEAAVPTSKQECEGYPIKEYPAATCNKVVLKGSYELLQYAWQAAFSNTGMNRLKFDKGKKPFEIYENDPTTVDEEEILTAIYIPVKS